MSWSRFNAVVAIGFWLWVALGCAPSQPLPADGPVVVMTPPDAPTEEPLTWDAIYHYAAVWSAYDEMRDAEISLRVVIAGGPGDRRTAQACYQRKHCDLVSVVTQLVGGSPIDCERYPCPPPPEE